MRLAVCLARKPSVYVCARIAKLCVHVPRAQQGGGTSGAHFGASDAVMLEWATGARHCIM